MVTPIKRFFKKSFQITNDKQKEMCSCRDKKVMWDLPYHKPFIYFNFKKSFISEPRSTYAGRQLLVGYWGQNGAGPANGPANYEKPLLEVCRTTKFDILAVSFVIVFFDARNKGILGSQPRDKVAMLVINTIAFFSKNLRNNRY